MFYDKREFSEYTGNAEIWIELQSGSGNFHGTLKIGARTLSFDQSDLVGLKIKFVGRAEPKLTLKWSVTDDSATAKNFTCRYMKNSTQQYWARNAPLNGLSINNDTDSGTLKAIHRGLDPDGTPTYLETLDKLDQWSTAQYVPDRLQSL